MAEASSQPRSAKLALLLALGAALVFMPLWGIGAAEATVLCKAAGNPCTSVYKKGTTFKLVGGTTKLSAGYATVVCEGSTAEGTIDSAGSQATSVVVKYSNRSFSGCYGESGTFKGFTIHKPGSAVIHWKAGSSDGTFTDVETEITHWIDAISCTYGTPTSTDLGTLKGGETATLTTEASITRIAGGFLCANPAKQTTIYEVSTPKPLFVAEKGTPATVLCKTASSPCSGGTYGAETSLEAGLKAGTWLIHAGFASIKCEESKLALNVQSPGGSSEGERVTGTIGSSYFGKCNGTVNVLSNGTFTTTWSSGNSGTVSPKNFEVTVATAGTSCTYALPAATLTGGSPAVLKWNAGATRTVGGFLCANPASVTAEYTVESPNPLYVSNG
jgi:hypothetical protein